MRTEKKDFDVRHWMQLSKEQLVWIMSQEESDAMSKVKMFLYLAGLRVETDDVVPDDYYFDDVTEMDGISEVVDLVGDLVSGEKVCLRDDSDRYYYCEPGDLNAWADDALGWLMTDKTLVQLPFESMKVGKHEYKMPDGFLINTTYQQYSNAQGYMTRYWELLKRLVPPKDAEADASGTGAVKTDGEASGTGAVEKPKRTMRKRKRKEWKEPTERELVQIAKELQDVRLGFMASMLTPYRWRVKSHYPFLFREPLWDAESEKEIKADMEKAPKWLFDVLYKQLQDNVYHFRGKFPDLFCEAKEDPKHDAFVAELGSINLVIEKGGYGNASEVYKENCVFVFKLLNDVIKEGKEIEKMNKESKAKR